MLTPLPPAPWHPCTKPTELLRAVWGPCLPTQGRWLQRHCTLPHALATPHAFSAAPPLHFFSLPADEKEVVADAVIIATGAVARRLPFKGSDEDNGFWNKGISACAVGAWFVYLQLICRVCCVAQHWGREQQARVRLRCGQLLCWLPGVLAAGNGCWALPPVRRLHLMWRCSRWHALCCLLLICLAVVAPHAAQVCDGAAPMFRNQPIAVIGGGDSGEHSLCFLLQC